MTWQVKAVQGIAELGPEVWDPFAEQEGVPTGPFFILRVFKCVRGEWLGFKRNGLDAVSLSP